MAVTRDRIQRVFAALFLAGALFVFAGLSQVFEKTTGLSGTPLFAALWLVTYALGLLALGLHRRLTVTEGLLVLSVVLSLAANPGAGRMAAYAVMFGLTTYLAAGLSLVRTPAELLRSVERIVWVALLVSLAGYALSLPGFRMGDGLGRANWLGLEPLSGLFSHKINAGTALVAGLIVTLFLRDGHWRGRLAVYLFALSLTDSAGAIVFGTLAILWGALASAIARRTGWGSFLLIPDILLIGGVLLVLGLPQVDTLMGRDIASLTGRIPIWLSGLDAWRGHPAFGLGYENVVTNELFLSRLAARTPMSYLPPHLHNSYIQALVATGAVGFAAFVLFVLSASLKVLGLLSRRPSPVAVALTSLTFFLLAVALTEVPFAHNSFGLVLFAFLLSSRPEAFAVAGTEDHRRRDSVSTRQTNFGARTR